MKYLIISISILFGLQLGSINNGFSQTHKPTTKKKTTKKKSTAKADSTKVDSTKIVKKDTIKEPSLEETKKWLTKKLSIYKPNSISIKSKDNKTSVKWKVFENSFDQMDKLSLMMVPADDKSGLPKDFVMIVTIDFSKLDPNKTLAVENNKSVTLLNISDNDNAFKFKFSDNKFVNKLSDKIYSLNLNFSAEYEIDLVTRLAKALNRIMNLKGSTGKKQKEAF